MEENNEEKFEEENETEPRKLNFRFELLLFLILGFLLGVVIKTEAAKRITIGYDDREVISAKQSYDFKKIQTDMEAAASQSSPQDQETGVPGASN